jgi:hypothetical protein
MYIIGGIVLVVVVFFVVVLVLDAKDMVAGSCPKCRTQTQVRKGVGACHNCGEALRHKDGVFVLLENGFVPDHPRFLVKLPKLKHPSKWIPIWDGRCCICGGSATRTDDVKIKVIDGSSGITPISPQYNITKTISFPVGYCANHSDGIRYAFPPGIGNAKSNDQCIVAFRAGDYYREFMRQNRA